MIVVQHGTGPSLDLHKSFGKSTKDWAESHNCVYIYSEQRICPDRSPHWEKPKLMLDLMRGAMGTDFLWADTDIFVVRKEVSPVGVLQDWADLAMCMDRATPFNSGLFFIRSNERTIAYMQDVVDKGPIIGTAYHDQSRMCEQLQFHPIRLQVLPWEWNQAHCTNCFRGSNTIQKPIIEAYHGCPKEYAHWRMQGHMNSKRISLKGA